MEVEAEAEAEAGIAVGKASSGAEIWGVLVWIGGWDMGRLEDRRGRTIGEEFEEEGVEVWVAEGEPRMLDRCSLEKCLVGSLSSFDVS